MEANQHTIKEARYCRICFKETNYFFDMKYGTPSILDKILLCMPFMHFNDIKDPVFCGDCNLSLSHSYLLLKQYLHNNHSIEEYILRNSPTGQVNLIDVVKMKNFLYNHRHSEVIDSLRNNIELESRKLRSFEVVVQVKEENLSEDGIPTEEIMDLSINPGSIAPNPEVMQSTNSELPNELLKNLKPSTSVQELQYNSSNTESTNTISDKRDYPAIQHQNSVEPSPSMPVLKKQVQSPANIQKRKISDRACNTKPNYIKSKTKCDIQADKFVNSNSMLQPESVFLVENFEQSGSKRVSGHNSSEYTDDAPDCDSSSNVETSTDLDINIKIDDLGETDEYKHKCRYCEKGFQKIYAFKRHLTNIHYKNRDFNCTECDKSFGTNYGLKRHQESHYEIVKVHECKICNKKFPRIGNLTRHELIHTGVKQFKCSTCEKSFTDVSTLRQHVRHVHNHIKNYNCAFCGNSFAKKNTLTKHMVIHTKQKPHSCTVCHMTYRDKSVLRSHMMKNHSEKLVDDSEEDERRIKEEIFDKDKIREIILGSGNSTNEV